MRKYLLSTSMALFAVTTMAANGSGLDDAITKLRESWDHANYQLTGEQREKALQQTSVQAEKLVQQWPGRAEPLAWQGIALASWAGAKGGLGALGLAKQARDALLKSKQIDSKVLNGSIYTTLGSLYYKVPGWPIGFGDDDKARDYLLHALRLNPDGIDPNYFYGDFLIDQGKYQDAIKVLRHALDAPSRRERPLADKGRRQQVQADIDKATHKMG